MAIPFGVACHPISYLLHKLSGDKAQHLRENRAPVGPIMLAVAYTKLMVDAPTLQVDMQFHVVDRERIIVTASDEPSHLIFLLLRQLLEQRIDVEISLPLRQHSFRIGITIPILHIGFVVGTHCGTQRTRRSEQLPMSQGINERSPTTCGGTRDGTATSFRTTAVVLLDIGDKLLDKEILKGEAILRLIEIADPFLAIGIGCHHDHRCDLTLCDSRI